MKNPFTVKNVRDTLHDYVDDEISLGRCIQILNEIAEKHYRNQPISDEKVDEFITGMLKENPAKFVSYAILVIGRDIYESGAEEFKFSQSSNLDPEHRFKIEVTGTITPEPPKTK